MLELKVFGVRRHSAALDFGGDEVTKPRSLGRVAALQIC